MLMYIHISLVCHQLGANTMAKMTLLEMVQNILSDMEEDVVTSYTDTVSSQAVAEIIKNTYDNIISGRDWPHLYKMFKLTSTGTNTPTRMILPETIMSLEYVKYNKKRPGESRDRFTEIPFFEPQEFMRILDDRDGSDDAIAIVNDPDSQVPLNVYTDRHPTMYTSFSEAALTFDGYYGDVENGARLFTDNTQCYGRLYPNIVMANSLYFPLPIEAYQMLLEEAKSTAFLTLKQMPNQKAEQHSVTQRRRMSQQAWTIRNGIKYPDYGRKGKGMK